MDQSKPPSASRRSGSPLFFIGRNRHGNWVVQDQHHVCGGLFVDRTQALKFALFENGNRPQVVVMVPGILELDMGASALPGRAQPRQAPTRSSTPRESQDLALAAPRSERLSPPLQTLSDAGALIS
jgi:hypothetical protein